MLIHVGLMKAGSTWLQNHLFNNEDSGFGLVSPKIWYNRKITQPNELEFSPDECRAFFKEQIRAVEGKGQCPVLSSERFAGSIHSGGYDTALIARRLKVLFPDAKILLVIREQESIAPSVYKEYINEGGLGTIRNYFEPPYFPPHLPGFDFGFLEYDRLIRCYHGLFGAENVLVLPLEMLKTDPGEYASRIVSFAGCGKVPELPFARLENQALRAGTSAVRRCFNMLTLCSPLNGHSFMALSYKQFKRINPAIRCLDTLLPGPVHGLVNTNWKKDIRRLLKGRYQESNRRTSKLIGIDLSDYGYELPLSRPMKLPGTPGMKVMRGKPGKVVRLGATYMAGEGI